MKLNLQNAKGVRDIPPEEMILRQEIIDKLRKIFERYGFNPLETPTFERYDVLSVKYGAGEESDAMKEVFKFQDQGKRDLGLRYELTLSMCKYIAMNPNTKMPFKRYEIGRVYRDGPIKLGRAREFYQCDVDIVGSRSLMADAEIILLGLDVFSELGLDAYMEVNSRKILNSILEYAGVDDSKKMASIIIIDKLNKVGLPGIRKELKDIGVKEDSLKKIEEIFSIRGSNQDKLKVLKDKLRDEAGKQGIEDMESFFGYFSEKDMKNIVFNISLARGLSYYTGTIFEGFLKNSKMTSSICGGGRYDKMISQLLQSSMDIPAIGISFGLVPLMEALKLEGSPEKMTKTEVYIIPIGKTGDEAFKIVKQIRDRGINADIDLNSRSISKNLSYVSNLGIPYVIFIGEKELEQKKVKMRNMNSGKEELMDIPELLSRLTNQ